MTVASLILLCAAVPAQWNEEFAHDFRSANTLPPGLQLFVPNAESLVRLEPQGLRISLPAKRTQLGRGVGVEPQFVTAGDFEITVHYELLAVEKPTKGRGSGVNLYIEIGTPTKAAATLARVARVKEGESYVVWRRLHNEKGKGADHLLIFPAKGNTGKIRLTRIGSTLHYLVAEENGEEFRELAREDFVSDDVRLARAVANTGESPTALDVRLREFQVRSGGLAQEPTVEGGRRRIWLVWAVIIAGVSLVAVGWGVWCCLRRREKHQTTPPT